MSQSIRFLGLAIMAWATIRAVSLGMIPGMQSLAFDAHASQPTSPLPAIQPTILPSIEPAGTGAQPSSIGQWPQLSYPSYGGQQAYLPYPIYVPVAAAGRSSPPQVIYLNPPPGEPREVNVYGSVPPTPLPPQQLAMAAPITPRQSTPSFEAPTRQQRFDRLSVSSWATMRNDAGPDSLASGGMLGGSEAGARLMWRLTPKLAASLRSSAPINSQRGAEAALGLRYQPFTRWPVAVTLERRHGFRDYGQSAFALFTEGGVYGREMPWQSALDGYFQAGVVDFNDPDWFVDGQLAVTRPVWRTLSAGLGAWGGAQPKLNRFDVGPRASLRLGPKVRAHVDYRLNVAGNARPGSGAVVTLAGDF